MSSYLSRAQPGVITSTPVGSPIPGRRDMVRNTDGGGFVFELDDFARTRRWLILGSEGGTYYAGERQHSLQATDAVLAAITADGPRVIDLIREVSHGGLARRNDEALYALALAVREGDERTKAAAYAALADVARTGTYLFMFASFLRALAGGRHVPGGPGLRRAIGRWYNDRSAESVAYQAVKYRQRHGFTHDDMLRVSHAAPVTPSHAAVFEWITLPPEGSRRETSGELPPIIEAFLKAQNEATTPADTARLVRAHRLPREALKTTHLSDPDVNMALLEAGMPMTALIRNLANLTRYGVLEQGSVGERIVIDQLANTKAVTEARVHPMAVLIALFTYAAGYSGVTHQRWTANPRIADALDEAFYLAFGNVKPTGKRRLVAIDVSGSMTYNMVAGVPGMSAMAAAAAMAMTAVHSGDPVGVVAISNGLTTVPLSKRQRLDDVWRLISSLPFQGTDLSLPMRWALANGRTDYDAFEVWTDNEVNSGTHPSGELRRYRQSTGKTAATFVVGALTATPFTIADPRDPWMLDVVGMDAGAPALIAEFEAGRL